MRFILGCLLVSFVSSAWAERCQAHSGPYTAALVELYTSEGCSRCPPADRWLSSLGERYVPARVVPLALHVDYRDYIGWKDPYARREFSLRQRKLTHLQRMALVYTPQVLLQGRDFRRWGTAEFDGAVERINAQPAKARIWLQIRNGGNQAFEVEASAELLAPPPKGDAALYLAAYENRLSDYVVLEWQGPFVFGGNLRVAERRKLPLLPRAAAPHSGVVGFVQDRGTGEVLQALMLPACFS